MMEPVLTDAAKTPSANAPLIEVTNLTIDYWQHNAWLNVVNRVSFSIFPGEAFALVGESGCGKSTTVYTLLGYHHPLSRIRDGKVRFQGRDLLSLDKAALQQLRGGQISLVPQDPASHLTPSMRVGDQIAETLFMHRMVSSPREATERTRELLQHVRIPNPERSAEKFPHQMSGGQQQRVAIAMALACNPKLVVLDEPTTGLDVTTQAHILDLLAQLREEHDIAMAYVTHDLSVVATLCDRTGVMYAGELVEQAPTDRLFEQPRHPYTRGLIAAVPRLTTPRRERTVLLRGMLQRSQLPIGCKFAPRCEFAVARCFTMPQMLEPMGDRRLVACWRAPELSFTHDEPTDSVELSAPSAFLSDAPPAGSSQDALLLTEDLSCAYERKRDWTTLQRRPITVVQNVSFSIARSETFALVGESGSGKSTIARTVAGLLPRIGGRLMFDGAEVPVTLGDRPREMLRRIRLILQNPDASLNPRQRVVDIVGRPLEVFLKLSGGALRSQVEGLLYDVRLDETYLDRFPHQLSGGERQRVAIACALAAQPDLLICDEVLSALDVSVQAEVLDLLRLLQAQRHMAYLFISHDLAVVRSLAHRVGVLFGGELCEVGLVDEVYTPPYHPYTHVLLSAVPSIEIRRRDTGTASTSELESAESTPACPFAIKCPWKLGPICDDVTPPWQRVSETHALRCHIPQAELLSKEAPLWKNIHALTEAQAALPEPFEGGIAPDLHRFSDIDAEH